MTQNIYDDDDFFDGYSRLSRSVEGLAGAGEWPALRAILPPVHGLRVADLGCGYGWFCRWASGAGAASALGLDVSRKMLDRARSLTVDETITYRQQDLEQPLILPDDLDLVYSSLTIHYISDLAQLIAGVHRSLRPGGSLVFSVEHPLFTAPSSPGFVDGPDGRWSWPVNDYLREGVRTTDWIAKGVIKQHRTIGTYVTTLLQAGLRLTHLEEWGPTDEQIAANPDWVVERDRPPFLLVAAQKATS